MFKNSRFVDDLDEKNRPNVVLVRVRVLVGPRSGFSGRGAHPLGREQGPAAMIPWRIHGLHLVDVGDGECVPVCLTTTSQIRDRTRRGGGSARSPFQGQSEAPGRNLRGSACTGGSSGHGDTVSPPQVINSHSGSRTVSGVAVGTGMARALCNGSDIPFLCPCHSGGRWLYPT